MKIPIRLLSAAAKRFVPAKSDGMVPVKTRSILIGIFAAIGAFGFVAHGQQSQYPKQTQLPNPYQLVENWPALPKRMNGGKWGELIRADIDPQGNIWVFHRCFNTEPAGFATCVGRTEPPILQFDPSGELLKSLGRGMFEFPPGFTVDRRGKHMGERRK